MKVVARIKSLASRPKSRAKVVTVSERENAMEVVTKLVQWQAFSTEMKALEAGKSIPSFSPFCHLDPILKGGRLHVGGRLKHSSLSEEFKHWWQVCHQG